MAELKKCPFCKCHDRKVGVRRMGKKGYKVICGNCGASGGYITIKDWHDNKMIAQEQAIEAWNNRATESEIREKAEHTYENCHNLTCRRKCQKDGYNMAIDEFAEKLKSELSEQIFSDEEKFKYARKEQEAICAQNAAWKVAIRLADYVAEQLKEE